MVGLQVKVNVHKLSRFAVVYTFFHHTNLLCLLHTCLRKQTNNTSLQQKPPVEVQNYI